MLRRKYRKIITFSVPIRKELDSGKTITYKLEFIDSFRFISTSSSKLVDDLSENYSANCGDKNCKSECQFKDLKNNNLSCNCKGCRKKNSQKNKKMNGLIEMFPNTYKFCNNDTNKFILLLRKGVYPYEYMDCLERFNENTHENKKAF